ncbi:large ribosomal subunit protein mL40-like [Crassostrea virginica]
MVFSTFKQCSRLLQAESFNKVVVNKLHTCKPQYFHESTILNAMPMKRKVKIDPRIIQEQEQRKRRKYDSQLAKLDRQERTLKPVDEYDSQRRLRRVASERTRETVELSREEILRRIHLEKRWCTHTHNQYRQLCLRINLATKAAAEALAELRKVSEKLYVQAIQENPDLLSYSKSGPTLTPPIKDYPFPDGEYNDVTKQW